MSHLSPVVTASDLTVLHLVAQFLDGGQVAADPVQPVDVQTWQKTMEMGESSQLTTTHPRM